MSSRHGPPVPAKPSARKADAISLLDTLRRLRDPDLRSRLLVPAADGSGRPLDALLRILAGVVGQSRAHNLNVLAAGIGLYAFLALLPFVASVAIIWGMFAEPDAVQSAMRSLLFMAPGRAQDLVAERLAGIIGRWNGGSTALVLGLLFALYAAGRAARSILSALNLIHGCPQRTMLKRLGASIAICLAGGLVTLIALLAIAASGYLEEWVPGGRTAWLLGRAIFWIGLAAALSLLLALLYRYGPHDRPGRWRDVAPGAVAASLLWLFGSLAFSAYVPVFTRYESTYGSLAGAVVLQLWLYASAFVLLLGAQLNVEISGLGRELAPG